MDEEKENQEQGQKQQSMPEQLAKQGADLAKQQVKNAAKKKVKEKVAAVVVANIVPIVITILVLILLFGFLFPAFDNFLDEQMAEDVDEITYQTIEEYCTIDETGVHMDKEGFLKAIIANLAESGIDLNSLGFGNDGNYTVVRKQ